MFDVKCRVALAALARRKRRGDSGAVVIEDLVDETLGQRLLGSQPMIPAIHIGRAYLFDALARALRVNLAQRVLDLLEVDDAILQLGGIAEHVAHRLVDHDLTVAAHLDTLAAAGDERRRRCRDAVDVDRDVGRGLPQEVEDGDTRGHIAADGVDPYVDLAVGSLGSGDLTDDILGAHIAIVADFAV